MKLFRIWWGLLKALRVRLLFGILFIASVVVLLPTGWTPEERLAAQRGYIPGLLARVSDPVFWERTLLGTAAFACVMAVFILVSYFIISALQANKREV